MAMAGDEVEIALAEKIAVDAAQYEGSVAFANFRDENSDGEAACGASPSSSETGTVIEVASGREDAVLRGAGN